MPSFYQDTIHEIDPTINPAGVEASMRLQFSTLDHLGRETFEEEIKIARQIEASEPGWLKTAAQSHNLTADFERWQQKLNAPDAQQDRPATSE